MRAQRDPSATAYPPGRQRRDLIQRGQGGRGHQRRQGGQRGQVLPIFAVMCAVALAGAALLTDVAWWWVNQQRMERAADAGALAGAIYLPDDETSAFATARAEAAKNGFTDGVGGVSVTPRRDPGDPRKLIVTVDGPVSTHFAKVVSMESIDASATGAATYVLPVPMGSPQRYYGMGFFQGVVPATTVVTPGQTDWRPPTATATGTWTNPDRAYLSDDRYASKLLSDSGRRQEYRSFGVVVPSGAAVTGIEVRPEAHASDPTGCQLQVRLYDGSTWSGIKTVDLGASPPETPTPPVIGAANDGWGLTWSEAKVEGSGLLVRVEAFDPGSACADTATVYLDWLEIRVHYTTSVTTPESYRVLDVPDPVTGSTLASQGFWGAIFTSGGVRENGDRYAPLYIGGNDPPDGTNGGPNPDYDPNGYDYTVEVGAGGQVRLFDPVFCATGTNLSGGWFGTGDHWTTDGTGGGTTIGPVAVRFKLFDTRGTPFTTADDVQVGTTLTYDPGTSTLGDFSGYFSRAGRWPQNYGRADAQDCSTHPAHNQWVLPSGWSSLPAGTYRINVNTNLGQNANHGAENLFSIWSSSSGKSRVYGGGRMAAYTNLDDTGTAGRQQFYFAQIEQVHAGKRMVITLFDPGEASSPSYLRFLTPDGGTYRYATFDWHSNDGRSGTGVTEVQTSTGTPLFNNRILTIEIGLPADYGSGGLDPNGLGEEGWWQVEYDVRAGNDTTTWEVRLLGNPVHLVLE